MKNILTLVLLYFCPLLLVAQGESNIWLFGERNALNFNTAPPTQGGIPGWGSMSSADPSYFRGNAVCDANGQLLFYTLMDVFTTSSVTTLNQVPNIYHANGQPMANSNLLVMTPVYGGVQIIKKPGANKVYYLVYSLNKNLCYTAVDMALNSGNGAVVSGEKGIVLSGYNTVVGEKTVVFTGCNSLWLVVRSRTQNAYKAYEITEAGISATPVMSYCGNYSLDDYFESSMCAETGFTLSLTDKKVGMSGKLKASPDNRSMVACTDAGLELYDFEPCSGSLSNPRTIDTTGIYAMPTSGISGYVMVYCKSSYYSACFSPDGTKLYATYMFGRHVYQFDLAQPSAAAIMASKTIVFKNKPLKIVEMIYCTGVDTTCMGDMKLGPDGKIYFGNNSGKSCSNDTAFTQYPALHIIHNPNLAGMACNPQMEAIVLPTSSSVDFNPVVVMPPPIRDTLSSYTVKAVCATDSIYADTSGNCYSWNTGATDKAIRIDSAGLYVVCWRDKNCALHVDSFQVAVPPMPLVDGQYFGCPDEISINVLQRPGDTTTYHYHLQAADASFSQTAISSAGQVFNGLTEGVYTLRITAGSCDTLITLLLQAFPKPEVYAQPADTTIRYGDSLRLQASGALLYVWWPTAALDTATSQQPMARPLQPTMFSVLGINEYGCRDTAYVRIGIDYSMPDALPNAFSPNGDGLNDVFALQGISYQKVSAFRIFNRYGQEVFAAQHVQGGWDGTFKGQPCELGIYYYLIVLEYPDGKQKTYKGDLTLIR